MFGFNTIPTLHKPESESAIMPSNNSETFNKLTFLNQTKIIKKINKFAESKEDIAFLFSMLLLIFRYKKLMKTYKRSQL